MPISRLHTPNGPPYNFSMAAAFFVCVRVANYLQRDPQLCGVIALLQNKVNMYVYIFSLPTFWNVTPVFTQFREHLVMEGDVIRHIRLMILVYHRVQILLRFYGLFCFSNSIVCLFYLDCFIIYDNWRIGVMKVGLGCHHTSGLCDSNEKRPYNGMLYRNTYTYLCFKCIVAFLVYKTKLF